MNIDCCKSYVGKQIIGLLPDGGGTPPQTRCLYVAMVDFLASANDLFFDDGLTQPMFSNNIGDGALRTMMQTDGGELYGIWNDGSNFIFSGCHIYYYGTSAMNIDVYSIGGYLQTITFSPMSAFALPCEDLQCYTVTIDEQYTKLQMIVYNTPVVTTNIQLNSNPPYGADIDLTDEISTALFFRELYGQNVNYTYVDNGNGTYTITMDKAIDWLNNGSSIFMVVGDNIGGSTDFELQPC